VSGNSHRGKATDPKPQPAIIIGAVGKEEAEGRYIQRNLVRITSYRCRLLDPDNLAGGCKYAIDAIRKAKVIKDDREQDIRLEIFQVKTKTRKEEKTIIEVE